MSVRLMFECDGCTAKSDGTGRMVRKFQPVAERTEGFDVWRWVASPEELAPEGWIAADPWTSCCYCPKCWQEIMEDPNGLRPQAPATEECND